jgi:hypothetical protein
MMEMTLGRGLKDGPHECVECENSTDASVIRGSRGKIVCKDMERRAGPEEILSGDFVYMDISDPFNF